jgi:hypothetical protein
MEGAISQLMFAADEDYYSLHVHGKDSSKALNADGTRLAPEFDSLLGSALGGLAPGPLPAAETAKYRAYLATDEVVKAKPGPEVLQRIQSPAALTPTNLNTPSGGPQASRPARAGSKRQYTDTSFQGYGEGFVDDFGESTGGEDNAQGGMAKKRRLAFERTSHQVEVGGVRR